MPAEDSPEASTVRKIFPGRPAGWLPGARAPGPWSRFWGGFVNIWRVFRANPLTLAGFVMVVILIAVAAIVALLPPLTTLILGYAITIVPYDPVTVSGPPGLSPSLAHLMGTDQVGFDVYSRVLTALPLDLYFGIAVSGLALLIGGGLGLVAGYWDRPWSAGQAASEAILRTTDVFLAFPPLILALAIAALAGRGLDAAILAILLTWWPYYTRLVRGEVLSIKHQLYVTAARAAGVTDGRILLRHVLRNLIEPIIVYWTMDIGSVIIVFATISFFGLGVQPPTPEWGADIGLAAQGGALPADWWLVFGPGAAIFVTVLAFSLLGDGLRDVLDPRSRRALSQTEPTHAAAEH